MIPFDERLLEHRRGGVLQRGPGRAAGRRAGLGRGELPLRREGEGRPGDAPQPRGVRDRGRALVEVDGETVSSTRIRALVAAGDMEGAMHCLGAPFLVEGTVVEGDKRGRTLGFPTANVVPDEEYVCPGHGVYAAFANGSPGGGERRRAADVRDRPRPADRGVSDRPRRGPLRAHAAGRVRRAAARREAVPERRGSDRADAPRRRPRRASSAPSSTPARASLSCGCSFRAMTP